MKVIYKYPLALKDSQTIYLPFGSRILSVQTQNDILCLWCLVETNATNVELTLRIIGTGNKIEDVDNLRHLGTVQTVHNSFVWHVFVDHTKTNVSINWK